VTAVSRFRNNVQRRQELNVFLQNAYPQASEFMDEEGNMQFWRDTFQAFGFENRNLYFPENAGYESRLAAQRALSQIIAGGDAQPDPRVNHRIWLKVFKPFMREYELTEGRDENVLQRLRIMVAAHENMQAAADAQRQQQGQIAAGGEGGGLPGEVAARPAEAQEGAIANV